MRVIGRRALINVKTNLYIHYSKGIIMPLLSVMSLISFSHTIYKVFHWYDSLSGGFLFRTG